MSTSLIANRYDKDGSGSIEIDEMVEIVGNLFELEGLSKVSYYCHLYYCCLTKKLQMYWTDGLLDGKGTFRIYVCNGNVTCP